MTPELLSRLIRFGKIAGAFSAIAAAIVGMASAVPIVEPWVAAHRGYVREVAANVENELKVAQDKGYAAIRDMQIEQAEGKRDQTNELIFRWKVELGKAADDQTKALMTDRLRELEATKQKLENQIDVLTKARGH